MNRYWGGMLVLAFIAAYGLYLLYKAFCGETLTIYSAIDLSPKLLFFVALSAEILFFSYIWLGIRTGVI